MKPRQLLLLAALALTLFLVWQADRQEAEVDVIEAMPQRPARPSAEAAAASAAAADAAAPRIALAEGDLFPRQSWRPPPPPPPPPTPPPPPMPPPLPFAYIGKWQEDGKDVLFLAQGNRVLNVRQGETHGGWRVDEVKDNVVVFTYVPMDMQQTLRIGQ